MMPGERVCVKRSALKNSARASALFAFVILEGYAVAQTAPAPARLPADLDAKSYSRLPLVQRDQLTPEGQRAYDAVVPKDQAGNQRALGPGPTAVSLYSPGVAEALDQLHGYLARKSVVGPAMFQICSLIATREFDDPFNWNAHEGGAKRANVDQKTIDAIKYNRPVDGLPEKDALVITFGRALFHERKVSPELYAKMVDVFGKQGMVEITSIMGTYSLVDLLMRAVDQQPANPSFELPAIKH